MLRYNTVIESQWEEIKVVNTELERIIEKYNNLKKEYKKYFNSKTNQSREKWDRLEISKVDYYFYITNIFFTGKKQYAWTKKFVR